jgi:hypothetical protein
MFVGLGALDTVAEHADDAPKPRAGVAATDEHAAEVAIETPADDEHDEHTDALSLARSVEEKATQDGALSMGTETEGMLGANDAADGESTEPPVDYPAEQPSGSAEDGGASADGDEQEETALTLGADDAAAEDDVDYAASAEHEHTADESTEAPGDADPAEQLSHADDAPSGGEGSAGDWSLPLLRQQAFPHQLTHVCSCFGWCGQTRRGLRRQG